MTTFFAFSPQPNQLYEFQPVLDGTTYTAVVTWNVFGARYYINIYDPNNNLVLSLPLISSPPIFALQALQWLNGIVTVESDQAINYPVGTTLALTLSGTSPAAYNGDYDVVITGPNSFTYPLPAFPGQTSTVGIASYDISLTKGYFASTLIYREATGQFEVTP